jgi:hypothetical protein
LLLGVTLYSVALALACRSLDEVAIGVALRLQARLSFGLFVLALVAPALSALGANATLAWAARRREALFRAFAVSHLIHGLWVLVYFERTPATFVWNLVDVSGALTFPIIALLLLPLDRWLGARAALVRRSVVVYVWVQFIGFFIDRLEAGRPELRGWYLLAIGICIASALIALGERRFARRSAAS